MKAIKIGNKIIGEGHPTFIIAEIGSNFDGSLGRAKMLVDLKDDFLNRNERQPTIDEARQINVSGYALSKTA